MIYIFSSNKKIDIDLNQLDKNLESYFKDLDLIIIDMYLNRLDEYLKCYLDLYVNHFNCMTDTIDLYCYETLDNS